MVQSVKYALIHINMRNRIINSYAIKSSIKELSKREGILKGT